jgi:transcriptional regulator with XRE-family HTH domain
MNSQEIAKSPILKLAIVARNLTQRRVAKRAHIEETRFSRIVRGHVAPLPREQKAIARVLQRPVEELFPEALAS